MAIVDVSTRELRLTDAEEITAYLNGIGIDYAKWANLKQVSEDASDQEILDAKAKIAAGGFGCEPASAASVAGARLLCDQGIIGPDERVVCILTGHQLKDPTATVAYHTTDQEQFNKVLRSRGVSRASYANRAVSVSNNLDDIVRVLQMYG